MEAAVAGVRGRRVWRGRRVHHQVRGGLPQGLQLVSHDKRSIGQYVKLYNRKRPHSSLTDQTPDEAYFATLPAIKSAA